MIEQLRELDKRIEGDVRYDSYSKTLYSVDASIFQIEPKAIVRPRTREDVIEAVRFAADQKIPVIPRGAATGIAGGCIGDGLIIDLAQHMNKILEINCDEEYAIVEAGVIQDHLNAALVDMGYRFGPDTSTGNRATIGGMYGNNSSGAHSLRYGKTIDNVLEADLVLATGEVIELRELGSDEVKAKINGGGEEGKIYEQIDAIRKEKASLVRERFPKIQRRVSGYSLDEILDENLNLAKLACGAEGTFGITTKLKVKISKNPAVAGLVVIHFEDLIEGLKTVPDLLKHDPFAVELMDNILIENGQSSPSFKGELSWMEGQPHGLVAVEFDATSDDELQSKIKKLQDDCVAKSIGYAQVAICDKKTIAEVWELRKAGLGLLMARRTEEKAIAFLEDAAVPPEKVGEFMGELQEYVTKAGKEAAYYGHAGVGLIHVRPMLNLADPRDVELMVQMMEDFTDVILGYGGAVSGEHGDGLIRSWLIERAFGEELYQVFRDIKKAFDPDGSMNPGKIIDGPRPDHDLRISYAAKKKVDVKTMFNFADDGGFAFAAGMCNGNAACRKFEGIMCPSFQASNDEDYSTRARATVLQKALFSDDPVSALAGDDVYRVMEYCLQCKGCKTECPSQVDIARMKSEFLYHYQKKHGTPLRSQIFGNIDTISKLSSPMASLANFGMSNPISKAIFNKLGITDKRKSPPFAKQTFSKWYARRGKSPKADGEKVALFVDTFSQFNYPEIAQAAIKVLEALDCDIHVAEYSCCGRPAISKGMLDQAKSKAQKIREIYAPLVSKGYKIVGLEPSCILTFRDEHPLLVPGDDGRKIAAASMTIEEYLCSRLGDDFDKLPWNGDRRKVLLHGHCHQKAQVGTSPAIQVLSAVPGFEVNEIDSGCCGMAGTFGYETEHYEFSIKVGEQRLFPAIRESSPETIIVASGLSCRSQIEHGTQREGLHMIEAVAAGLN